MNKSTGDVQNLLQISKARTLNVSLPAAPVSALRGTRSSTPSFTGRESELSDLEASPFVVISGMAGVGKTELALRFAEGFDGDRLFCDFHGYDSRSRTASDALEKLLVDLGVREIPMDEGNRESLFRSCLADRDPVLVVLDNVSSARQVRPLLVPGHQILITSRHRLTGIDGAHHLTLPVLPIQEAVALVGSEEIASLCGNLPLALQIVAALQRSDPDNDWAADLREMGLGTLEHDGEAVRAAFDLSYQALPVAHQQAFPYLSLLPGDDVTVDTVSALLDSSPARTRKLLRDLQDAHLLESENTIHDLVHRFASDLLTTEPDENVEQAFHRALRQYAERSGMDADPYVSFFSQYMGLVSSLTLMEARTRALQLAASGALTTLGEAIEFNKELDRDKTQLEIIRHAFQTLIEFMNFDANIGRVCRQARELIAHHRPEDAVQMLLDTVEDARSHNRERPVLQLMDTLGPAYAQNGQFEEAIDCMTPLLSNATYAAAAHFNTGMAYLEMDRLLECVDHLTASAELYRAEGDHRFQALSLAALVSALDELDRQEERDHAWSESMKIAETRNYDDLAELLRAFPRGEPR